MCKIYLAVLLSVACTLGFASHLTSLLDGILVSIEQVTLAVSGTDAPTSLLYKKDPVQKTGQLSKIINGTTVALDYTWDCTVEDWRRVLADWKTICENPPGDG